MSNVLAQLDSLDDTTYTLECGACEFRSHCMCPLAPIKSSSSITDLMVIAEKPSFEEESAAFAFGDRHHKYLTSMLNGIFDNIYYTYLLKCFTGISTLLNKTNTKTCREKWLELEISKFQPKKILCLGTLCAKILGPKAKFGEIKNRYGFWQSAAFVYMSGQKHQKDFLDFLHKLKHS